MQVVPVVDLKNGAAVHAVKGQRDDYRELRSRLCDSAAPMAVVEGLLRFYPFRCIYLADLNALTGQGDNRAAINHLAHQFPCVEFWVDQGWPDNATNLPANLIPILGSESMDTACVRQLASWQHRAILSLDFFGERYSGPSELLETPQSWPLRIILMTLGRVGSGAGPDWPKLQRHLHHYPQHRWIAAGGVRHAEDLSKLADMGVWACLIASSLHQGAITAENLSVYA